MSEAPVMIGSVAERTAPVAVLPRAPRPDLDVLLTTRLRRSLAGTPVGRRHAVVVLDAGEAGCWTVEVEHGRGRARRGGHPKPSLTVRATLEVLAGIVGGSSSGVRAFLDGDVVVRGDLALALQLDGLFTPEGAPAGWTRAGEVTALGVRTAYLEAGPADAPPVVLLHGLGATGASLLPLLPDLARDHRVLIPDLPGFGASDAPRAAYSAAWYAAWAQSFQVATGTRGALLVGNSMGGRVAIEAALQHPSDVRGLVLLAPSPAFRRLRQFVPFVRVLTPELARLPLALPHSLVVDGIRSMFSDPDRLPGSWHDAAADEFVRVMRSPAHRVAFFACARQIYLEEAYGDRGFWQRLPRLDRPALFVWGDRDRLVPASFARHVAEALPDAGSIVVEDCGHVPQFEHPELTGALVRGFLEQL